jgi:para-aminobenzoate synthetase component 1
VLDALISRYELGQEVDLPFPLGGCFGYWGYDLKNFIEPGLPRGAFNDLEFPDCHLGFYDSLVVFDHHLDVAWILATGLQRDGSRSATHARQQRDFWLQHLAKQRASQPTLADSEAGSHSAVRVPMPSGVVLQELEGIDGLFSNISRDKYLALVARAQRYIHSGDIYQVNLAQRLTTVFPFSGWRLFRALSDVSPAPFSAYLDAGGVQVASSSPELFLRISGFHIQTRPIKGTRPRSMDATRDSQLSYQLQTSAKEMAELVMITDLLRNDLGRVCEFGTIQVPELARLERYPHVQHLVSTVEGTLRSGVTHLGALAACFPGGSITGAPKIRAMQIIDELEPICRGPYTGALGYVGFNRESQLSMIIRTALRKDGLVHFHVGAGIVADSVPDAEYLETIAKARGFFEALRFCSPFHDCLPQRQIHS